MSKKIVFIIKPDFVNRNGMIEMNTLLTANDLRANDVYKIPSFKVFSEIQRETELEEKPNGDIKHKQIKATIEAYKQCFKDFGLVIVVENNKGISDENFYQRAKNIKKYLRNKYVKGKETSVFVLVDKNGNYNAFNDKFTEFDNLVKKHGEGNLHLAHFNCIHLEDYEEFIQQHDYKICKLSGVFDDKNRITIHLLNSEKKNETENSK